jgi:2-methylcitrate dehydratase PrpD
VTANEHITRELATFACTATPPGDLRHLARRHVTDTIAVMVAGRVTDVGRIVAATVRDGSGGHGAGWQIGGPAAPIGSCAFVNAVSAHALDFDDDDPLLSVGHPSGPVVAGLLALAPSCRPAGATFMDSYLVGVETQLQLGRIINPSHYDRGWHATATLGALGAASAASRMLGLTPEMTCAALGIAAAGASGLRVNFGTMAKPIQVGNAAQVGVTAAMLASRGATAAQAVLDGPLGYPAVVSDPAADLLAEVLAGGPWLLATSGVAIKRYPCCSNTHTAIDGLLELRASHDGRPLEKIVCKVSPGTETIVPFHRPDTGLQGKFSFEHCLAVGWLAGEVGIGDFTDSRVNDPAVRAVAGQVEVVTDPAIARGPTGVSTRTVVELTLHGEPARVRDTEAPVGSPRRPMTDGQVRAKAADCLRELLTPDAAWDVLERIWALPEAADVGAELTALQPRIEVS